MPSKVTLRGMDISRQDVIKLSQLARLELTDQEVDTFVEQLPKIVDYVSQLQRVDTVAIVDTSGPTKNLREDEVEVSTQTDAILDQAPERHDRFWKVDQVFS